MQKEKDERKEREPAKLPTINLLERRGGVGKKEDDKNTEAA